ncbi:MAG: DEAD/DEAH box helicase [Verrucomicrobiota bacterium]
MFSLDEVEKIAALPAFKEDFSSIKQSLVDGRLHQPILIPIGAESRLLRFVEVVLDSAPDWPIDQRYKICKMAAEISEAVALKFSDRKESIGIRRKAVLLYELAELPALAAATLQSNDLPDLLLRFFQRSGKFRSLNGAHDEDFRPDDACTPGDLALVDDAISYCEAAQSESRSIAGFHEAKVSSYAWKLAARFQIGISASELRAFSVTISNRAKRTTVATVDAERVPALRKMSFPLELLPAQRAAIGSGLLDRGLPSWGFAAPTGSGKTFISRLLINDLLSDYPDKKILYLVPSKALVSEIASDLGDAFSKLNFRTLAVSAQLIDLDDQETTDLESASIVVITPEKADMLLRLGAEFLKEVALTIVDEAHHIEASTRGALLELYLWRLKQILSPSCRYVFLSAVAPNIREISKWMDPKGDAVTYENRPTRMRVGVYRIHGTGIKARGEIRFTDDTTVTVVSERAETRKRRGICELASFLRGPGPVLVVAKGKRECENIAEELLGWLEENEDLATLTEDELSNETFKRLDSCIEREMYSEVPIRKLIKYRIAYHHAGLPPNVRQGIESAIRNRMVDFVIATTTLAEGVNFPFSSVIVQSLALREPPEQGRPVQYSPVTPRSFWNIAGRAGRPGFDAEGQVILFEPSLGLERINAVLDPYLDPSLTGLTPVRSALADAIREIQSEVESGAYVESDLRSAALPDSMSRRAKGALNLVRIGVVHAKAAGLITSPEEILYGSFARQSLSENEAEFGSYLMETQSDAMDDYLKEGDAPSMEKLAELGLSLETLTNLRDYVRHMSDWQLESCGRLFFGSSLNLKQAPYIIGPVAKRMSELEGPTLGGFLSNVIVKWLSGVTFTTIIAQTDFRQRLEDLIALVYSRVQFLLPWGLWVTDWLVEQEAKKRKINYENQIKNLAYLSDVGVPNLDASHLVHLGFERVDSTRLTGAYFSAGGLNTGVDFLGWLFSRDEKAIEQILRGRDNRRIDFDFFARLEDLKGSHRES